MLCLKTYIRQNPFFLAPMAGVTDQPFRSFMREMGCGVMTSELVSARALQENNRRSLQLMKFEESHRPYGIQIFGEDSYIIGEGAKRAEEFGADFIDLNLGCPVNKIVKKGAGSALLKDLKKLAKVLNILKNSVQIPVSLKVRTGWDEKNLNADQVAHIAFEEGFEWMSIHGRTRAQAYSGKADWDYIKKVQSQTPLKIVGNGDLISGRLAGLALKFSACFAVMIGRGCLNDPWIFLSAREYLKKMESDKENKLAVSKESHFNPSFENKHVQSSYLNTRESNYSFEGSSFENSSSLKSNHTLESRSLESRHSRKSGNLQKPNQLNANTLFKEKPNQKEEFNRDYSFAINCLKIHLENFYDERLFLLQFKKFSAWFSAGFPNSTEFRKNLFQEKDKQALVEKVEEYFKQVKAFEKPEPVYEPFLMQGHG